jgi:hypothetical protein
MRGQFFRDFIICNAFSEILYVYNKYLRFPFFDMWRSGWVNGGTQESLGVLEHL